MSLCWNSYFIRKTKSQRHISEGKCKERGSPSKQIDRILQGRTDFKSHRVQLSIISGGLRVDVNAPFLFGCCFCMFCSMDLLPSARGLDCMSVHLISRALFTAIYDDNIGYHSSSPVTHQFLPIRSTCSVRLSFLLFHTLRSVTVFLC